MFELNANRCFENLFDCIFVNINILWKLNVLNYEEILNMYRPLIMKESIVNGLFDEDLFQEQCIILNKCIKKFKE